MNTLETITVQIKVTAVVEKEILALTLGDALSAAKGLRWEDILPGIEICDGSHCVVGLFEHWQLEE